MVTLKAEKRDMSIKAKALRRQGKVIGSISGKDLPTSISIQLNEAEAKQFLKEHGKGSQAVVDLDGEKYNVLLKEAIFDSIRHQYETVEFQALVAGEKVTGTAQIIILNADAVKGFVTQSLTEVSYKALPSALVEKIEIDASTVAMDSNVLVGDLELAKNKDVEIITPADALVLHVAEHQKGVMESGAEEAAVEETSTEA